MRPGPRGPTRRPIPRSLPFNISRPLLNYLGFACERDMDCVPERLTRSMLGEPLERAALRRGLIERSTYRIGIATGSDVVPFKPTGREMPCFRLTRYGRRLGAIGKRARAANLPGTPAWAPFVQEATFTLDEAIRESNLRVA